MAHTRAVDRRFARESHTGAAEATAPAETSASGAPPASWDSAVPSERLAAVEAEREQWRERATRLAAELDNLRKVVERRVENEVFRREQERLARWLELGDALDRALRYSAGAPLQWRTGLEEIARTFDELLRQSGVERVETVGQFDPAWHEAVAVIPDPSRPDGSIAGVERAGWRLGDRLLRPARVIVVRNRAKQQ